MQEAFYREVIIKDKNELERDKREAQIHKGMS